MMNVKEVAILGAGNGGITAAADLTSRGFSVRLYEMPQFAQNLEGIRKKGGITLKKVNSKDQDRESFQKIAVVTSDIKEAVEGADVVMLTVPGFAIESLAEVAAPHIKSNQYIFLNGAASMGALRFVIRARAMGVRTEFMIAEANSLTYATRANPKEAEVELSLEVKHLLLAAYPAKNTQTMVDVCNQLYNCFVPAQDLWEVLLANGNPEAHPAGTMLSAGHIDYFNGDFWMYKQGITPHTVKVVIAAQNERIALGRALGFELDTAAVAREKRGYFSNSTDPLDKLFNESEVFLKIKGPTSLHSRYLTEDIPLGLVLWADLGKALGVPTPTIDALITIGCELLDEDYWETGLTLEKLGFAGFNRDQLLSAMR